MNQDVRGRLAGLLDAAKAVESRTSPPLDRWNPPDCGDIDMRIAADGTWLYAGSPIARPAMVRLFASVMKRERDRYVLVTPVEKVGIAVDDVPFLAVDLAQEAFEGGTRLVFRTNLDDVVRCDAANPLRFTTEGAGGGLKPYVHVRRDLWARLTPSLAQELVHLGEVRELDGEAMFGIASAGAFFPIARARELELE